MYSIATVRLIPCFSDMVSKMLLLFADSLTVTALVSLRSIICFDIEPPVIKHVSFYLHIVIYLYIQVSATLNTFYTGAQIVLDK